VPMKVELWANHIGLTYGTKVRCYWEHLEEHIGNLMGTHWGQSKNTPPPPPIAAQPKRKKKHKALRRIAC